MNNYDFTDLSSIIKYLTFKYNMIKEILEENAISVNKTIEYYKGEFEQLEEIIRILKIHEYSQKQRKRGGINGSTNKSNTI